MLYGDTAEVMSLAKVSEEKITAERLHEENDQLSRYNHESDEEYATDSDTNKNNQKLIEHIKDLKA